MLSVIICSRNPKLADRLKRNIASTIGVPFEYIVIDNSHNKHSLFSAYNEGIQQSRFQLLCFLHEDVEFVSNDWGKNLSAHLSKPNSGIVGLCGGMYQSRVPSSWSLFEHTKNIIQSDKKGKLRLYELSEGYDKQHEKPVVGLDGVFLAARRDLFNYITFDKHTFYGFHTYDLDICIQAHVLGYTNIAVNDILLIHYSKGCKNRQWMENIIRFADKWQDAFPLQTTQHSPEFVKQREYMYMKKIFLKYLVRNGYSNRECKHLLMKYMTHHPSFMEWVESPQFNRRLFALRLKKKPLSLIFPPASRNG